MLALTAAPVHHNYGALDYSLIYIMHCRNSKCQRLITAFCLYVTNVPLSLVFVYCFYFVCIVFVQLSIGFTFD